MELLRFPHDFSVSRHNHHLSLAYWYSLVQHKLIHLLRF